MAIEYYRTVLMDTIKRIFLYKTFDGYWPEIITTER